MAREKIKFALRIAPETQQLVKELCERDNCQSQNEFIEKAIRFYAGYVSGKEATAYLQFQSKPQSQERLYVPQGSGRQRGTLLAGHQNQCSGVGTFPLYGQAGAG